MATKKTTKPKASSYTKQIATRMDVVAFARLLATSLGNDRWFTQDVIKSTFNQSGPAGTVKKDVSKATKIPNLESDGKVMSSLSSIYDLLKKNYEDKLKSSEKKNQFMVEQSIERKKQNDEFIKALKSANGSSTIVNTDTATKVNDEGGDSLLGDLLGVGKTLLSVASFFTGPIGLALLLGTLTMAMLFRDKDPEATTKGILNAGDISSGGTSIQEARSDEVASRKAVLLRDAYKNKLIKAGVFEFKKQGVEEKAYLTSIGFDDKTGLTQKDRDNGFNAVDEDGIPYRSETRAKEMAKAASTDVAVTPTSEPDASTPASPSSSPAASVPAASTPASPSSSPAASVPAESSLSKGESVVSTPDAMPAQMSSPNVAQKLDVVNNENLDIKLPQAPSDRGMIVINNEKTQGQKGSTKAALPFVRNDEETFQRMILNSTRVV
jgi:hypothetical protein